MPLFELDGAKREGGSPREKELNASREEPDSDGFRKREQIVHHTFLSDIVRNRPISVPRLPEDRRKERRKRDIGKPDINSTSYRQNEPEPFTVTGRAGS